MDLGLKSNNLYKNNDQAEAFAAIHKGKVDKGDGDIFRASILDRAKGVLHVPHM